MTQYAKPFDCEVITPDGHVFSGQAVSVTLPAADGALGVLAERRAMAVKLGAGILLIQQSGGEEEFFLAGGFARMRDNILTILAEQCIEQEKLNAEQAWEEIQRAKKLPSVTPEAAAFREEAIKEARIKFKLAQEIRRKYKLTQPGTEVD